jgi:hypothetical protein
VGLAVAGDRRPVAAGLEAGVRDGRIAARPVVRNRAQAARRAGRPRGEQRGILAGLRRGGIPPSANRHGRIRRKVAKAFRER